MRRGVLQIVTGLCLTLGAAPASADIVFSQSPNQRGGFVSDRDQTFLGYPHFWAREAEDFQLSEPEVLTRVVFYGFYASAIFAPPSETMRIRFFRPRESDGLPDEGVILYEQTIQDPQREETGEVIQAASNLPEYRYTINLSSSVAIEADTTYWIEAVQIGDPNSDFFWESAITTTPQDRFATRYVLQPDWFYQGPRAGLAFQLLTPEPNALWFMALGLLVFPRRRGRPERIARSG